MAQLDTFGDGEPADDRPARAADLDAHGLAGLHVQVDRVGERPALPVLVLDAAIDGQPARGDPVEDEPARLIGLGLVVDGPESARAATPATVCPAPASADLHDPFDPPPAREGEIGRGGQLVGRTEGESRRRGRR